MEDMAESKTLALCRSPNPSPPGNSPSSNTSSTLLTILPIAPISPTRASIGSGDVGSSVASSPTATATNTLSATSSVTAVSGTEFLRSFWVQGVGIGVATGLLTLFLAGL